MFDITLVPTNQPYFSPMSPKANPAFRASYKYSCLQIQLQTNYGKKYKILCEDKEVLHPLWRSQQPSYLRCDGVSLQPLIDMPYREVEQNLFALVDKRF